MTLAAAMAFVAARRPQAMPNAGFRLQLALAEVAARGASSVAALDRVAPLWGATSAWRAHPLRRRLKAEAEAAAAAAARRAPLARFCRALAACVLCAPPPAVH